MAIAPLINGYRFSYSSLEISALIGLRKAEIFIDVDDLSYEDSIDIEFKWGTSRAPLGWTAGRYAPGDASMQMGKSTCAQMIAQVGPGYMGINFTLVASYADVGELPAVDVIVARIVGISDAHSAGAGPLVSVVKLKPISILRNGVPALLNSPF